MHNTTISQLLTATAATLVLAAVLAVIPGSAVANQGHDEDGSGLDRGNVLEIIARHPPGGETDHQYEFLLSDNEFPPAGTPAETDPDGADLSALTLASQEAEPLYRVAVEGLPAGTVTADLYAEYYVADGDFEPGFEAGYFESGFEAIDQRLLPLFTLEEDAYLLTPLLDPDGANLLVRVTDGASVSEVFELAIRPLPAPHEGAVDELVVAMERLVKASTEALGKVYPDEWESWRDQEMNQMPEYLFPLMQSWQAVADPQNPEAWVNQEFDQEERILMERVLAARPFVELMQAHAEFIESGESGYQYAADSMMLRTSTLAGPSSSSHSSSPSPELEKSRIRTAQVSDNWEVGGLIPISDAPVLQEWLQRHYEARTAQEKIEMFDETVGNYLTAVALVGSLPAKFGARPAIAAGRLKLLEGFNTATGVFGNTAGAAQWFLPCCIVDLDITLDPAGGQITAEDSQSNQITLVDARARAESSGVDLTRKLMESVLNEAASLADDSINDLVIATYGEAVAELFDGYGATVIADKFLSTFPPGADMVFYWDDIDMMAGEPQKWLEVQEDTLGPGTPILGQASTGTDRMEFRLLTPAAFERQDSLLRFFTSGDELRSAQAVDTVPVNLNYIEVDFEPSRKTVSDDDVAISFEVIVSNFVSPDIERPLTVTPDVGSLSCNHLGDGVTSCTYNLPDEFPEDGIIAISTESIATGGIRDPGNNPPARTGTLFISEDSTHLVVEPDPVCMAPGETIQFHAIDRYSGEEVADVEWSASEGSITDSGLYTAASSGNTLVTATAGPGTTQLGRVTVGDCSCYFSATLSGYADVARSGFSYLSLGLDETAHTDLRFFGDEEGADNTTGIILDLDPPLLLGASGPITTTTRSSGYVSGYDFVLFGPDGQLPPLTVEITERSPVDNAATGSVFLAGRIHGGVNVSVIPDLVPSHLDIQFNGIYTISTGGGSLNCNPDF